MTSPPEQRRLWAATTQPLADRVSLPMQSQAERECRIGTVFTHLDHVGIAVLDLDEALAFYAETFDLRCVHEEVNEEQGVREAMLAIGDSGTCIQLLAPLHPDSAIGKFLDRSGPGIQQIAYRVTDIDSACTTLRERGLRLLYDSPKRGTANSRVNFIHPKDAGGVLVELVEPAPDHPTQGTPATLGAGRPGGARPQS